MVCWSASNHPLSGEKLPWFVAFTNFCAVIIPTIAGFKLPTWHHCTWAWEELQEAGRAGSSTPLFARSLQDQEEVEGKVTEPGRTSSPSIGSLGQQEFLESSLLDTFRLNSKMFLLVYSNIRSRKRLALLIIAVSPAPKPVPGSY